MLVVHDGLDDRRTTGKNVFDGEESRTVGQSSDLTTEARISRSVTGEELLLLKNVLLKGAKEKCSSRVNSDVDSQCLCSLYLSFTLYNRRQNQLLVCSIIHTVQTITPPIPNAS